MPDRDTRADGFGDGIGDRETEGETSINRDGVRDGRDGDGVTDSEAEAVGDADE